MKALIHIGMGKTGTTALQKSLALSRKHLERRDVLYPTPARPLSQSNHQIAVWGVLPADRLPRDLTSFFADEAAIAEAHAGFAAELARDIRARRPACVAISAESLFRPIPIERLAALAGLFAVEGGPAAQVEVVAYLRRPSARFASSLQQALKYSHLVRKPLSPRYRDTLESYEDAFGFRRVHARTFDRAALVGNDVIADFVATFLAPFGVDPARLAAPPQANETLSGESARICRDFRRAFHADRENRITEDSRELVQELQRLDQELGAGRPRLRPRVAEAIDYSSPDPLWLRDRYGVEFPDFDYRRLERRGPLVAAPEETQDLDALLVIDPAVEAALLERLRASPWADAGPESGARLSWIDALLKASNAAAPRLRAESA